jgi:hypothetical protein
LPSAWKASCAGGERTCKGTANESRSSCGHVRRGASVAARRTKGAIPQTACRHHQRSDSRVVRRRLEVSNQRQAVFREPLVFFAVGPASSFCRADEPPALARKVRGFNLVRGSRAQLRISEILKAGASTRSTESLSFHGPRRSASPISPSPVEALKYWSTIFGVGGSGRSIGGLCSWPQERP